MKRNSVILIPALNPDKELIQYIQELKRNGFDDIIVVNDGSSAEYLNIFERAKQMDCKVLQHAVNLGKGRALKNGFNEFLNLYQDNPDILGIITVDSDGQHAVKDVIQIDDWWKKNKCAELLLGSRNFKLAGVPFKSRAGNQITSKVYRLLYGIQIRDTQTGLRGIPKELVAGYLQIRGERFEYEMEMLIESAVRGIPVREISIQTIYKNQNTGSHFRPFEDSVLIYRLILSGCFRYWKTLLKRKIRKEK